MNGRMTGKGRREIVIPKAKVDSSVFTCSLDSISDIWNTSKMDDSPYANAGMEQIGSKKKVLFANTLLKQSASVVNVVPDNKVYMGVQGKEDELDVLISKLKEYSYERKERLSLKMEKIYKPSPTNLSLETKVRPQGELIIKSFQNSPNLNSLTNRSQERRESEFLVQGPKIEYRFPCIEKQKNRAELKISKKKIIFSPIQTPKSQKTFNKPFSLYKFPKITKSAQTPQAIYSQGKSPLFINSLSKFPKFS